ncbi:MAG: PorV/PorQ family protein [Bacteroidia bacterium]
MKKYILLLFCSTLLATMAYAQPEDIGQAGAMQLTINSWARSSGMMGIDISSISGIESNGINPAGLATTDGSELVFSSTRWLIGSDININSFGFSQRLGDGGSVIGLTVSNFSLGDIVRTTTAQPDGTLGNYTLGVVNLSVSYAKKFTDNIYVGTVIRMVSESTPEVRANGLAFDAGVQYRTGLKDRLKIGISLRNVGPTMQYSGDGLSARVLLNSRNSFTSGVEIPTADYELPAVLSMGASYDMLIGDDSRFSLLGSYISNASFRNQIGVGAEFNYKDIFMARGGYLYEEGSIGDGNQRYDVLSGLGAGITVQAPVNTGRTNAEGVEVPSRFSIDVSYRPTTQFNGTLTVGARIDL